MRAKTALLLFVAAIITTSQLLGCPTYKGRMKLADEPFFAENFRSTIIHSDEEDPEAYQALQEEYLDDEEEEDEA